MTVQPQLLLLQKTMLMAEGMGTRLNPHVNIWELARPLIEDWMREHFGPRATIERAAEDLVQGLRRVPRLIDSLHLVAERERRKAERDVAAAAALRPPLAPPRLRRNRRRPRPDRRHRRVVALTRPRPPSSRPERSGVEGPFHAAAA